MGGEKTGFLVEKKVASNVQKNFARQPFSVTLVGYSSAAPDGGLRIFQGQRFRQRKL